MKSLLFGCICIAGAFIAFSDLFAADVYWEDTEKVEIINNDNACNHYIKGNAVFPDTDLDTVLDGGGGMDRLFFGYDDGGDEYSYSGMLGLPDRIREIQGIEAISLMNDSDVGLGKGITALSLNRVDIEDGSAFYLSPGLASESLFRVTAFSNNGAVDMRNGIAGDQFTIEGNYIGDGVLYIDADLSVTDRTDTMVITGNAGIDEGNGLNTSTTVYVNNVSNSTDAAYVGDGVEIIHVDGESADNAFVLGSTLSLGLYDVYLAEIDESWYLQSDGFREEVAVIQALMPFIERFGYDALPGFHERKAYGWFRRDRGEHNSFWLKANGNAYKRSLQGDAATSFEGNSGWLTAGSDIVTSGGVSSFRFNSGVFGGIGFNTADVEGLRVENSGGIDGSSLGFGGYATLHQRGSYYIDGVLMASYHDLSLNFDSSSYDMDTWAYLASLEAGGCMEISSAIKIEPYARLIYQAIGGMDLSLPFADLGVGDHGGVQGELSLTGIGWSGVNSVSPFVQMSLIKNFSNEYSTSVNGENNLEAESESLFFGGAIGVSKSTSKYNYDGYYLKANALYGVDGGTSYTYSVMAGMKTAF